MMRPTSFPALSSSLTAAMASSEVFFRMTWSVSTLSEDTLHLVFSVQAAAMSL